MEEIKNFTELEEIYEAVVAKIPEITKDELDEYLANLSDAMQEQTDDSQEIDESFYNSWTSI